MMTQAERISSLEMEVSYMRNEQLDMRDEQREMSRKLDNLLALRNKGAGVFWLMSVLFGTSLFGVTVIFLSWFKS